MGDVPVGSRGRRVCELICPVGHASCPGWSCGSPVLRESSLISDAADASFAIVRGRAALHAAIAAAGVIAAAHTVSAQQSRGTVTARDTISWSGVDRALGRRGTPQGAGIVKYSFPRSDLQVTVRGVRIAPALALGSWLGFEDTGGGRAMMAGDLVLAEGEVAPVMLALQRSGIEQTALHNHLLGESPRVMYMHVAGAGDPVALARALRAALGETRTPMAPQAPAVAAPIDLDTGAVARLLGRAGNVNGGVYQVSVPRRETVRERGHVVPPALGVATAINFQPTGGGKAAVTGDFVMTAREVNPVIRALRQSGIQVTALHSHMLAESPRLFFMHFWANADAMRLARGLRAALDRMATRPTVGGTR